MKEDYSSPPAFGRPYKIKRFSLLIIEQKKLEVAKMTYQSL